MSHFLVQCSCGHQRRVTEAAIGLAGRCPQCGREIVITEDILIPVEDDGAFNPVEARAADPFARHKGEPVEYQPFDPRYQCARCRRPFRGDWDRRETDEGLLCNICANRAHEHTEGEGGPPPTAAQRAEMEAAMQEAQEAIVTRQEAAERAQREADAKRTENSLFGIPRETMRRVAIAGACIVLVLCFYYAFLAPSEPLPDTETSSAAAPEEQLPAFAAYTVMGIGWAMSLVAEFAALYLVLQWAKKLPKDVFRYDLIAVGVAAVVIWLLRLVPVMYIPLLGIVLVVVREAVVLYALHEVYRLEFSELVTYLIIHALVPVAVKIVEMFLIAGIGYVLL